MLKQLLTQKPELNQAKSKLAEGFSCAVSKAFSGMLGKSPVSSHETENVPGKGILVLPKKDATSANIEEASGVPDEILVKSPRVRMFQEEKLFINTSNLSA